MARGISEMLTRTRTRNYYFSCKAAVAQIDQVTCLWLHSSGDGTRKSAQFGSGAPIRGSHG